MRTALHDEMSAKGVHIHCDSRVKSIERTGDAYSLRLDQSEILETDVVMYATGRRPNTAGLGLEAAGVEIKENGAIAVDAYSRTACPSIFAIGDVTDRVNLTPVALAEGMAVVETLYGKGPTAVDYANIPSAVFSQPPVGTVGLTEAEARREHAVDIYLSHFTPLLHTLTGRQEHSMMKLVVDRKSGRVLGLHMVGTDAPEIAQGFAVRRHQGPVRPDRRHPSFGRRGVRHHASKGTRRSGRIAIGVHRSVNSRSTIRWIANPVRSASPASRTNRPIYRIFTTACFENTPNAKYS